MTNQEAMGIIMQVIYDGELKMVDEKILEEHHKICKTCWSGQDKVVGRRCSACINHSEYEPIDEIKNKNMVRK